MGFGEALAAVGAKIGDGSQYYRADGTVVGPIVTADSAGWNGVYGMHRDDLLNALAAELVRIAILRRGQFGQFRRNDGGDELFPPEASWPAAGDIEELSASFDGWDPRIVRRLETVESCYWWGLYDRRPLVSWTSGRLVLLGDAAHAMLPISAKGPIRRLKMASPWLSFSRGETRTKSQIFCHDMK
jgi:hypothetical protein